MDTMALLGAWLSIFLTICILSFLYEDNPIYKVAEHLFLGVSIAIGIIEAYYGVFKPNLIDKLLAGNPLSVLPLLLVVCLFFKLSRKFDYVATIPIAFLVAVFAGIKITGEANANLMTQVQTSIPDLAALYREHGLWDTAADGSGVLSGILLVLGLCACLLHFYFSAAHNRPLQVVSRFGVGVLMLSFGASFGYTVMGRISLAIGRAQQLLGRNLSEQEAEHIRPQIASLVSIVAIVAFLVAWKRLRRTAG